MSTMQNDSTIAPLRGKNTQGRRRTRRIIIGLLFAVLALAGAGFAFINSAAVATEAPTVEDDALRGSSLERTADVPRSVPRDEVEPAPVPPPAIELHADPETRDPTGGSSSTTTSGVAPSHQ